MVHCVHCTGGQSYCVGMWIGHRYKEPILQGAHAVWSLGATIGPLIIGQFLVDIPPRNFARDINSSTALKAADVTQTSLMRNYSGQTGAVI